MYEMKDLLQLVVDENASDLHVTVDSPPVLRLDGELCPIEGEKLTPADTERLMKAVTSEVHIQRVREEGGTDFGFGFGEQARFRVSVYRQKGRYALSLRLIPSKLMTFEEIGLGPGIKDLLYKPRGLVLVTGPTGSGKTTTLATMIDFINSERKSHIITIEDPIEYYHKHRNCVVTQREVGVDVPSFSEALRRALRQDPDVVLVGEMRDVTTMEAAITAAETGHLVFATLHTTGAVRTMDRIINAFPANQQEQIRQQVAASIQAVISQQLLVKADGKGRIAAFEVMIATDSIRAHIREKKTFRIVSDLQTGQKLGMHTLDAHLYELYRSNLIRYEDLIAYSQDPGEIIEKLSKTGKR
ncbi:MAG: PilT/PilU family type 4a pilus ATPase [bacterium]|nr:PilT/PilU family type 4a pilus ATPase [bacterium]